MVESTLLKGHLDACRQNMTSSKILPLHLIHTHPPPPQTMSDCHVSEPVDYPLTVQVLKATADLGGVEDGPLLFKARVAHVVDVKL